MKKLSAYVIVMLILFFIQNGIMHLIQSSVVHFITGSILMVVFLGLIVFAERKEISSFPVIGKYIQKYLVKV